MIISGLLMVLIDNQATGMAQPAIIEEFQISEALAQWSLTIYFLAQAAFSIPLAKFSELLG